MKLPKGVQRVLAVSDLSVPQSSSLARKRNIALFENPPSFSLNVSSKVPGE